MRLVFAGTPAAAVPALSALISSDHEVVAVLTRPDARAGRGRRGENLQFSPIKRMALDADIEVLQPRTLRDDETLARLGELSPDCCPVVAYGGLVPPAALQLSRYGWVNLHFSLLPRWRGAAPVQHAIVAGDQETGASVFRLDQGLDTGEVYATLTQRIGDEDTAGDLLDRLAASGADLLLAVVDALAEGTATATPQPEVGVTLAPKLTTGDAHVDFHDSAVEVDRRVRGCTPDPGAWTTWRDDRLRLGAVSPAPAVEDLEPGHLRVLKNAVLVGTSTHAVQLSEVQPAGRRPMAAADWSRGVRPAADERLR